MIPQYLRLKSNGVQLEEEEVEEGVEEDLEPHWNGSVEDYLLEVEMPMPQKLVMLFLLYQMKIILTGYGPTRCYQIFYIVEK